MCGRRLSPRLAVTSLAMLTVGLVLASEKPKSPEDDVLSLSQTEKGAWIVSGNEKLLKTSAEAAAYLVRHYKEANTGAQKVKTVVVIRADPKSKFGPIYEVLDASRSAGFERCQLRRSDDAQVKVGSLGAAIRIVAQFQLKIEPKLQDPPEEDKPKRPEPFRVTVDVRPDDEGSFAMFVESLDGATQVPAKHAQALLEKVHKSLVSAAADDLPPKPRLGEIQLRAASNLEYRHLLEALATCASAGFPKIGLTVLPE